MGLSRLKPADLVAKSSWIESQMDGNTHFPSPVPAIADVTAKRQELEALMNEASTGNREAIASKDQAYKELEALLKKLATYVSLLADGNKTVILSSGYGVRKENEPAPPLSRPEEFRVRNAQRQGEVDLRWKKVRGGVSYNVEVTTTDPADPSTVWSPVDTVLQTKHAVENLTPGVYYWFRLCAVGRKETSAYSNVELIMAT